LPGVFLITFSMNCHSLFSSEELISKSGEEDTCGDKFDKTKVY